MNARARLAVLVVGFALLAACGPGSATPAPTVIAVTAISSTVVPVEVTPLPADYTPPPNPTATPLPPLPSGASPTDLKYLVLAEYPNLFFCDPDYYPIAREDETDLARQRFPELQANMEEFQSILTHAGLTGLNTFTDEQKLLIYREHKRLAAVQFELQNDHYQFQLQIEANPGEGFVVTGLIDGQGSITEQQREPSFTTCPICLAGQTLIDTPRGPVAVQDLRPGDLIWTVDSRAGRVAAPIVYIVRVWVPAQHQMVHVTLADGRELWASPGHPTSDGRTLAELTAGDRLDGTRIVSVERVAYEQPATYDVLPAGDTGDYWANGIRLGSTLTK